MKKELFNLLMEVKAEIFKSIQPLGGKKKIIEIQEQPHMQVQSLAKVESTPSVVEKDEESLPETLYYEIQDGARLRKIAYTASGSIDAENILLCLPGLLETKASFLGIHHFFLKTPNYKVISVDFSGRGQSDYLDSDQSYKMSLYLSDLSQFVEGVVFRDQSKRPKLTVLGTSMGGVLAMYLCKVFGSKIFGIVLNDIALTVNWTSLYSLYKSMKNDAGFKEARELARDFDVDEKAMSDVQLPTHFDLAYQADVWGMNFHESLEGYKGRVSLIYGGDSKICTKRRVSEAKTHIPRLKTFEVPGAGHPAPFTVPVCEFIQSVMI